MNRRLPLEIELDSSPCCQADLAGWRVVGDFPLERCSGCGSAYVNPRPALEALKEHYAGGGHGQRTPSTVEEVLEADERYPNSTVDAHRILSIVSELSPGKRLLDVGCGYGFYVREAKNRGFRVDALELSEFDRRCTHQIAGIQPESVTFEEFETEPDSYDVILMSQILEHVLDWVEWIDKAGRLLTPGGLLALALPNFDSFLRRLLDTDDPLVHPPDHLNYFKRTASLSCLPENRLGSSLPRGSRAFRAAR